MAYTGIVEIYNILHQLEGMLSSSINVQLFSITNKVLAPSIILILTEIRPSFGAPSQNYISQRAIGTNKYKIDFLINATTEEDSISIFNYLRTALDKVKPFNPVEFDTIRFPEPNSDVLKGIHSLQGSFYITTNIYELTDLALTPAIGRPVSININTLNTATLTSLQPLDGYLI